MRVPSKEGGQRSGRKSSAWGKVRHIHILRRRSPYSLVPARLRRAFSRSSIKKWYVIGSCCNLSTPYPDFPRKEASKEANAVAKPRVFSFPASSDPRAQQDVTRSCLSEWALQGYGAKFGSDSLQIWLPLGSGVWPQGHPSSARHRQSSSSLQAE